MPAHPPSGSPSCARTRASIRRRDASIRRRDEVVLGYDEVTNLTEPEWQLLTPCLWAWAFYGVAAEVERMRRGDVAPHGFDWQVEMLLRRSPLMGPDAGEYRHGEV